MRQEGDEAVLHFGILNRNTQMPNSQKSDSLLEFIVFL